MDQLLFKDITVRARWGFRYVMLAIGHNRCVMHDIVLLNLIDHASRLTEIEKRQKYMFSFNKTTHTCHLSTVINVKIK